MTQLKVEMLDKLKAAVTGLASGEALINRAANLPQETIDAIVSVVNEAKNIGGRKENGEPAPRLSVDEARSLIKQIMFLSPRYGSALGLLSIAFWTCMEADV